MTRGVSFYQSRSGRTTPVRETDLISYNRRTWVEGEVISGWSHRKGVLGKGLVVWTFTDGRSGDEETIKQTW